ncbi:MAG: aromatic-ring-hydroxylating dioxygenase subunit beta [Rhodovibrionaceae bacterium]
MPAETAAKMESGEALDRTELRALKQDLWELYEDYAQACDRQDFQAWTTFFTQDCEYKAISRENFDEALPHATLYCDGLGMVKDRAMALRETAVYEPRHLRHFLSGLRVTSVAGDSIESEANFLVVESMSGRESRIVFVGTYVDRVVRTPQGLKFQSRQAVFDNYRVLVSLVVPI